jgi:isopentenyldiphosphate isomerase
MKVSSEVQTQLVPPTNSIVVPVDYILFYRGKVTLNLNPNEVQAIRYVTPDELKAMFDNSGTFNIFSSLYSFCAECGF